MSRDYPNSTETKYKTKIYNLAESSFISSCRELHSGILSAVAIRRSFRLLRALGDEISAPVSPCCHSRVQIFRLARRISIYPIYDTCIRGPTSRRRWRFAQLNTIRSVLRFYFFPLLIYFTVSNTRAVDQRIRRCLLIEPFCAFRVTSWLKKAYGLQAY